MQAEVIQRQYDEIIASHYDFDPQSVIGDSQDRAIRQLQGYLPPGENLRVLDVGTGTGRFLEKLRAETSIQPFGLDLSNKMIDIARARIPDMVAAVDDAANLEAHFQETSFNLICTHFITGFVPMSVLAPKIQGMLAEGGYWSFVGGTKGGFPALQGLARKKLLQWIFRGGAFEVTDFVCNPTNEDDVIDTLEQHGFAVCDCETFAPELNFKNFDAFLEFGYLGGWLTPFIEALGLNHTKPVIRAALNALYFPLQDHHSIVIALAKKL